MPEAVLYIVATPIGNINDMTLRATKTLENVDIVAAEDTRRAKKILGQIGISKKEIISYYDHVEASKAPILIRRILDNRETMALISDAGTPCVSDPGYRLVSEAHRQGVRVVPIPGASALTSLVSSSGLPSNRFEFIGFLPAKDSALSKEIESWRDYTGSVVFYESTRRLRKALNFIYRSHPEAKVCIGRELTKIHEEVVLLDIETSTTWCQNHEAMKGEVAVMVSGFSSHSGSSSDNLAGLEQSLKSEIASGKRFKEILKQYKDCGIERQQLYQLLVSLKGKSDE